MFYFFSSLSAMGWGWGGRTKFSIMHGCIPVIVQVGEKGDNSIFESFIFTSDFR
jgi:hypothetical protein